MTHPIATPTSAILLADDNADDLALACLALEKAAPLNPFFVVRTGLEAIDYLLGAGRFADRKAYPIPRLLLLDLRMPGMDGFDVLVWARTQPEFLHLPIVMLTSSSLESDASQARQLGASDFRLKPAGFENLVTLFHELHARWLAGPS